MKTLTTLLILLATLSLPACTLSIGWNTGWSLGPPIHLHYRIFELPADAADRLIPVNYRHPLPDSPFSVANLPLESLNQLTANIQPDTGLLADNHRDAYWPSPTADTWSYTHATQSLLGSGTGTGNISARSLPSSIQLHLDYQITHNINNTSLLNARLLYDAQPHPNPPPSSSPPSNAPMAKNSSSSSSSKPPPNPPKV